MNTAMTIVGIVHILLSIALICLILLQSGRTAGLSGAISGAADSFFGKNKGRTMDAMFSRFTKICAILFLVTSLFLAYADTVVNNDAAAAVETVDPAATTVPVAPASDTETAPAADAATSTEATTAPDAAAPAETTPAATTDAAATAATAPAAE